MLDAADRGEERTMRRTGWIAAAVALLVTTVGCGAGSATHRQASDVQVLQAAYGKAAAAKTAKMALVETIRSSGQDLTIHASGAMDLTGKRATMTMQLPQVGSVEVRMVGHVMYMRLPAAMQTMAHGKQWMSIDLDALLKQQTGATLSQLQGLSGQDPAQFMTLLQGVSNDVRKVGTEDVRGVSTTHYKVTLDLDKALARISDPATRDSVRQMYDKLGLRTIPADVWVDGDGLPRRVAMTMSGLAKGQTGGSGAAMDMTMDFYDYGTSVDVSAPPADQTTDLTGAIGGAASGAISGSGTSAG